MIQQEADLAERKKIRSGTTERAENGFYPDRDGLDVLNVSCPPTVVLWFLVTLPETWELKSIITY